MSKKLTPYEIMKNIRTALAKELTCVKADYDRALYHKGHTGGYYLVEIKMTAEGSVIGTYDIMWNNDDGPWDVDQQLIYMRDNPICIAKEILATIEEPFSCEEEPFVYEHYDQSGEVIGYTTNS